MIWIDYVFIVYIWNVLGWILLTMFSSIFDDLGGAIAAAKGLEFLNPMHLRKYTKLNWFFIILTVIFNNALCPIATICYWFHFFITKGWKK
jgi:hypothetical protein